MTLFTYDNPSALNFANALGFSAQVHLNPDSSLDTSAQSINKQCRTSQQILFTKICELNKYFPNLVSELK